MPIRVLLIGFCAVIAFLLSLPALAERKTVCTITVNSDDEKEAFRKRLPAGQYDFVELVEKGRSQWLESSCQRKVQCDVLVVSGHFNAGDDFYSDRLENKEFLSVDELERASCSNSCPGVFARLKEVYLFGCESLNPVETRNASHGESSRTRMRRIFNNVPAIYGFSSSAPVGPTAAMLLNKYFDGGAGEIGSGRVSQRLLNTFSANSMTHARGVADSPAESAHRGQLCQLFDDRLTPARKLAAIHRMMKGDGADTRAVLDRVEKLLASLTDAERATPDFRQAMANVAADHATGDSVLQAARATSQPDQRVRLVGLATDLGWLTREQQVAEHSRLISELLARNAVGYAEVDLVCSLNEFGEMQEALPVVMAAPSRASPTSRAAVLACLGETEAHAQVIRALSSPDVRDVQIAQAYLRNRPVTDPSELRVIVAGVTRMPASDAQVRALDTLARLRIVDRDILEELSRSFAEAKSLRVQRAIAEVFIRGGYHRPELAGMLRTYRLKSVGGNDLIDELIRKLQTAS
ncbi:MAG: hypothetical protein ABIQ72_18655 [Usitatibacter sp.]